MFRLFGAGHLIQIEGTSYSASSRCARLLRARWLTMHHGFLPGVSSRSFRSWCEENRPPTYIRPTFLGGLRAGEGFLLAKEWVIRRPVQNHPDPHQHVFTCASTVPRIVCRTFGINCAAVTMSSNDSSHEDVGCAVWNSSTAQHNPLEFMLEALNKSCS